MTPEEFKRRQAALGWTNAKMASHLRKTPQSISNYRNNRQKIPEHVEVLLDAALRKLREQKPSTGP
uniref:HTH cro/C1-type domain-containing protein n=1 Tax=Dinoroseobacter phage vB_DshS_R26L TaxID=3161158 RepID=A0AAU7VGG9_9CAUD